MEAKDLQKKGGTEQWKKYVRDKDFQSTLAREIAWRAALDGKTLMQ